MNPARHPNQVRWRARVAVCVAVGALTWSSLAAGTEVAFDAANKLYEEGRFADAAAAYEKLLAGGVRSAALYFNLGTAYYRAGQMGRAIAAYRRAEELTPRDATLRANLQFLRQTVNGDGRSAVPWWQRALSFLTLNEGTMLATVAFWTWFLLLAAQEARPAWRGHLGTATRLAGALTLLCGACLALAAHARLGTVPAVVVVREAVARFGPLDASPTAFLLSDGVEVTVLDTKDEWLQVRAPSKRIGWVKRDQVIVLSPTESEALRRS